MTPQERVAARLAEVRRQLEADPENRELQAQARRLDHLLGIYEWDSAWRRFGLRLLALLRRN